MVLNWDSSKYKPRNRICDDAWYEFLRAAKLLIILYDNQEIINKKYISHGKKPLRLSEPTIYSVFNKMRQDLGELPYSSNFISEIDKSVEKEFARE